MNNNNKSIFKGFLLLLATVLMAACGTNIIKPIQEDLIGNATVRNVTVEVLPGVKSSTIAARVKDAVAKEASDELKGNKQVDLKITLDRWVGSENVVGGGITSKLFGSKTELNGVVDILDPHTGAVLGKYTIYARHEEGGLLSAQKTVSLVDTDNYVIEQFAEFTINHLE